MTQIPSNKHGGFRPGSGRKTGSGPYGEPTRPVRIPVSVLPAVKALLAQADGKPLGEDILRPSAPLSQVPLPLFGSRVPAGFPSPADDHLEDTLDLNEHLISHPAATFFLRAQGHSMTGAGIHDGDLMVVDRSLEPKSGSVVIAVVNGEMTVKRLRVDSGQVWLMPENPEFAPLSIPDVADLHIWGVVAHVVHSLKR
jgi:DNA polymerase V